MENTKGYSPLILKKLRVAGLIELANRNTASGFLQICAFLGSLYLSPLKYTHFLFCIVLFILMSLVGVCRSFLCIPSVQQKLISTSWYTLFIVFVLSGFGIWTIWLCVNLYILGLCPSTYFTSLMIAGLSSGTVMSLATSRLLMNSVIVISVVPSIFILISLGNKEAYTMAMMFSIYVMYIFSIIKRVNHDYISAILNREFSNQSKQMIEEILNSVPGLVSSIDHQMNYVWTNQKLNEKFGLNVSHEIKKLGAYTPDNGFSQRIQEFIKSGKNVDQFEYQVLFPDGPCWMMVYLSSYQELGEGRVLIITYDIQELKNSENELDKQRAISVENSKLATLGEMSAGVAHEINNPLSVIIGKMDLMIHKLSTGTVSSDDMLKDLYKVKKESERIAKIIKGLKAFSRNGENDLSENIKIENMIEDVLDFLREKFKIHNVSLRLDIDSALWVNCRSTQIEQVLLNLLSNSYDAIVNTPGPWILIVVKSNGQTAEISVTDSGKGIAPEIVSKIMQPFYTTKEVGKGTGLGLSISLGIIKSHHGEFYYDQNSKNTRFVIQLPKS